MVYWLPNANEINTKNMKCTWPMKKFAFGTQRHLYSTDLYLVSRLASGVTQIFAFLDTNMLVSPMPNSGNARPQCENFASQWDIGFRKLGVNQLRSM